MIWSLCYCKFSFCKPHRTCYKEIYCLNFLERNSSLNKIIESLNRIKVLCRWILSNSQGLSLPAICHVFTLLVLSLLLVIQFGLNCLVLQQSCQVVTECLLSLISSLVAQETGNSGVLFHGLSAVIY